MPSTNEFLSYASLALTDSDIQILKTYVCCTFTLLLVEVNHIPRVKVHMPPN